MVDERNPGQGSGRFETGADLLQFLGARRGMPISVHLQVADRCNHSCVHCYQVQGMKGELSLDQVRAVLDDLARAGILSVNVSGGEATLRPDLIEILAHARSRGFAVQLYTNAFGITDAMAAEIARVGVLEVHVSVYSDREDEHDAITRVPGSLRHTLDGIRSLRAHGVRVHFKTPGLALAAGATLRIRELAHSLGCEVMFSTDISPTEDGALHTMAQGLTGEQLVRYGLRKPWVPGPDDAELRRQKLAEGSCGVCTSSVAVLPNGDVQPCTDTGVRLGNVTTESFADLYRNSHDVSLFRDLRWEHVHGCRDCDLLLACSRCHATALQQQGDYLGPYESACARARAAYEAGLGRALDLLPPAADCGTDRVAQLGPYRIESPGRLRPVASVLTDDDRQRALNHPWVRGARPTIGSSGQQLVPSARLVRRPSSSAR